MNKRPNRVESFQGYCPTQDKWEKVEQTYIDCTTLASTYPQFIEGMMLCPYISFKNGQCSYYSNCPVKYKGSWSKDSPDVFVAMQFCTPEGISRDIVEIVIKPVCRELGLNAFVVSEVEHNESIYDIILQSISKSRFVIADLTYNNNGAYYESGYAKGQGKPVIHCCSKEWFSTHKVHFDIAGLNLIIYDSDDDLIHKLKKRISETC